MILLSMENTNAQSGITTIYTNDMDYVLGDTKQRFITGAVTTEEQVDNLLKGFKTMKVNGIRIPIFPVGANPQPAKMDYFFEQAIAQGFFVFANPAQDSGAARIASGSLLSADKIPTKDVAAATATVIDVVSQFVLDHPGLKWINPFNEDGKPGDAWSAAQMNTIYSTIKTNMESYYVNGLIPSVPELVGPCVWGIPASIQVMEQTNIADYITVATSHNLGYNNSQWPAFIALGVAKGLPVWDSEVNNTDNGNGSTSRIDAAIANNVDGLVIYNSGNTINLSNGKVGAANEVYMSKYLKQGVNLALNGTATQSVTTGTWIMEASRAIDGNIAGSFAGGNGSITHTSGVNPWWQVDLGADKEIGEINIFNRTDSSSKANLSDFTVTVTDNGGTVIFTETYADYPDQALVIETGSITGQIVKIQLNNPGALTLAEVQIFAPEKNLSTKIINKINATIYPNPFTDSLKVLSHDAELKQYTLLNVSGQVLATERVNSKELEINVNNYPKGIYILKLDGDKFSVTRKLIKE
ncbi:T9SS type A sorting domain-containing protein [Mariniflexile ostreae]|uniref:T9SS type A sorting domain-containing protein n=1 Tax=Mariniflexile ostreae TaxID=1520892 RepID=A0ABV5F9L2_9FLAO